MGFTPNDVGRWSHAMGFDPPSWKPWSGAGYEPRVADVLAGAFATATPARAQPWREAGFSPSSAAAYSAHGCSSVHAARLRVKGVLPADLVDGAPASKAPIPWSAVLRRSRGYSAVLSVAERSEIWPRLATAVADLGAGGEWKVSLFSSTTSLALFLDGGVYGCDGYGFGSLHGTWVFGVDALALVCDRAGFTRPKWSQSPPRGELSRMWEQERPRLDDASRELEMGSGLEGLEEYALKHARPHLIA